MQDGSALSHSRHGSEHTLAACGAAGLESTPSGAARELELDVLAQGGELGLLSPRAQEPAMEAAEVGGSIPAARI